MEMLEYEYGIARHNNLDDPHRTGMTEKEAQVWIDEWLEMGGLPNVFQIIRCPIGKWEICNVTTQ